MKRLACTVFTIILALSTGYGQRFAGTWAGVLNVDGQQLHLVFIIEYHFSNYICRMQSPDQSDDLIPCSDLKANGDSLTIMVDRIGGAYRGKMCAGHIIKGIWSQSGENLPLDLDIVNPAPVAAPAMLPAHEKGPQRMADSIIIAEMKVQHIAGLSVGIIRGHDVILCKGYGMADIAAGMAATENTVYKVGSFSKQFIATCIIQLAEQGKLNLNDHITGYYTDAPASWQPITIRNLLGHTSGLERESPAFEWDKIKPDSVLIRAAYKDTLLFSPGTSWQYSNLGYFILADIIRKVTHERFEDYMNRFFTTCGMTRTTTVTACTNPVKAKGYMYYNPQTGQYTPAADHKALRPSGAFASCIPDLFKWDSIIRNRRILTEADWTKMWTDTVRMSKKSNLEYGYGWEVTPYKKHNIIHHGGNEPGFTSEYWYGIDDRLTIIILTNGNNANVARFAKLIYNELH